MQGWDVTPTVSKPNVGLHAWIVLPRVVDHSIAEARSFHQEAFIYLFIFFHVFRAEAG